MWKPNRDSTAVRIIVLALVVCLPAGSTMNAADPEATASPGPRSLAETLFDYAGGLADALHARPLEERSLGDYRRAIDAFSQVTRLNTDTFFSAESLFRMAELQREMADSTNDSALYKKSVGTLRKLIAEHPQSTFVSDALVQIAAIYEENLQDLDGAAQAYRELIQYFPTSVMAREARAVLARFEDQLGNRPIDVAVPPARSGLPETMEESLGRTQVTNVRNFGGSDYARVVIDLSEKAEYENAGVSGGRLSLSLDRAMVSSSLFGRRFIVGESALLKRVQVSELAGGVRVDIDVSSLGDYSVFRLADPERLIIDIHGKDSAAKLYRPRGASEVASSSARTPGTSAGSAAKPAEAVQRARSDKVEAGGLNTAPRRKVLAQSPGVIFSLPEITDPILPYNPADAKNGAPAPAAATGAAITVEAKNSEAPIKCIVIDPGHGGHDTGTISANGMREKELVLDVARRLRSYIKRNYPDVEVVLTRDSDRFIALEERTAIANARRADLFISVHANASESRAASGVETYFMSPDRARDEDMKAATRENASFATEKAAVGGQPKVSPVVASVSAGNRVAESRELARYIQSGLVRGIGAASPRTAANRGVKHAPFTVLVGAAMPSVLAEVSFMSNPNDEALLKTSQFRERIAASLFAGLNAYLKKNRAPEAKAK